VSPVDDAGEDLITAQGTGRFSNWREWAAPLVSITGMLVFIVQLTFHAFAQRSVLDEGAYLVKGLLFVTGDYVPFQDYGPLTNHMPLSFILPGIVQYIFGPGLRTARLFSIVLGGLFVVGIWLCSRRIGGRWWAAVVVWVLAVNPAIAKMYSLATSQGLVAALLVWTLFLILGEFRSRWQLMLGAFLAGILALTRINLLPVLPLILVYIFWQHGRRAGIEAAAVALGVFLAGQLVYFPEILKLWAKWIPESLTPFLGAWRQPYGVPLWDPQPGLQSRIISFFHGIRYHFVAMVAVISAGFLWPKRSGWKDEVSYKIALLLSGLFVILFLAHMWASLALSYCVFCFPVYQSFYVFLGFLIFVLIVRQMRSPLSISKQILIVFAVLIVASGIGFSASEGLGPSLLTLQVPRFRSFRILPGSIELWGLVSNLTGISYEVLLHLLPTLAGLLIGSAVLIVAFLIHRWFSVHHESSLPYGRAALSSLLVAGILLSPTKILGNAYSTFDSCGGNMIASYEAIGADLASRIPPGSTVYWQGGLSAVPLLYLKDTRIYPTQLNQDYTFYLSGEDDELIRSGYWNESLARSWLKETDFVLVVDRYFSDWVRDALTDEDLYTELSAPPLLATCDEFAAIRLFRRNLGTP
jgi:hypothetical protein